jgi:shikimate dehydrogenase
VRDRAELGRFHLIVNCTSTGLGTGRLPALPFAATRRDVLCCDLAYGRALPPFLARARAARRRTMDGLGMLLHQGALAFELWTGRKAPISVMRGALARASR